MENARIANDAWHAQRRDLLTAILTTGLAAFAAVVLLLLARRMAGALVVPLTGLSLVGVAGLGLLLAGTWRLGWQARGRQETSLGLAAPALPGLALFVLLCVLSLPGTANWALMLAWLAFFTCEGVWWWAAYAALQQPVARRSVPPSSSVVTERPAPREIEIEGDEGTLPPDVFQQITRSRAGEQERIAIMLRIPFSAGQRVAVAHVAFCPPLTGIPDLSAEVTEGPDASVTFTNPQTFGVRLEIRLEEPAEEACGVLVEIAGLGTKQILSTEY